LGVSAQQALLIYKIMTSKIRFWFILL